MNTIRDNKTPLKPILQSLVLADEIYVDERTKKKVIAGTFNQLWTQKFPAAFSRTTKAYLALTNCRGVQKLKIRYVDLQDESVLTETSEIKITSNDPLQVQELIMEVPPFPMPHEGRYAFEVYVDGDRLGCVRINVGKVDAPKEE